ncbi:HAD-like domain-containing protein [Neohortaea acidophila]|uniref:Mitochondrial import inner membrane translocase subunit TIM50 n=1 Tax=Neohortaea acidophila TaxID=245834 RepID=A0A6A6PHA0_9PEZI|nr:HAD-like domain-containing protein [Neohortaea acidophila]KAF2478647.1 HAD-like domain-containing protein [Neohortaea acidophila]
MQAVNSVRAITRKSTTSLPRLFIKMASSDQTVDLVADIEKLNLGTEKSNQTHTNQASTTPKAHTTGPSQAPTHRKPRHRGGKKNQTTTTPAENQAPKANPPTGTKDSKPSKASHSTGSKDSNTAKPYIAPHRRTKGHTGQTESGPLPPLPHALPFLPPVPPGFAPPPLPPYASSFDPTAPAYQPNGSLRSVSLEKELVCEQINIDAASRPEYMPQLQTNHDAPSTSNFHFGLPATAPYPLGQPSIFLPGCMPSPAEWQMAFSSLAVSKSSAPKKTPAPKPSPSYLQRAHCPAQRDSTPRPLLVILDLNGTLLSRNPHNRRTFKSRPKVAEFLDYLFTNHHVMVWSSATPKNVRDMCSKLLTTEQNAQLVACWGRDKLRLSQADYTEKVQVYKQLSWIWEDEAIRAKNPDANKDNQWSQANTVLIDDSALKGVSEPFNLVRLEEFTAAAGQMETDVLVQVARYLERLRVQRDVSAYIRCWPFAYDASKSFDWEGLVEEEH